MKVLKDHSKIDYEFDADAIPFIIFRAKALNYLLYQILKEVEKIKKEMMKL